MSAAKLLPLLVLSVASLPVQAGVSCETLKAAIDKKIQSKGVAHYTLEVVAPAEVGDRKVVGSCEGGSKRIVYKRG